MATGTVKWFKDRPLKGGYGFITPDDASRDVFFAFNTLAERKVPQEGQKVEYTLRPTTKGPVAQDLKLR